MENVPYPVRLYILEYYAYSLEDEEAHHAVCKHCQKKWGAKRDLLPYGYFRRDICRKYFCVFRSVVWPQMMWEVKWFDPIPEELLQWRCWPGVRHVGGGILCQSFIRHLLSHARKGQFVTFRGEIDVAQTLCSEEDLAALNKFLLLKVRSIEGGLPEDLDHYEERDATEEEEEDGDQIGRVVDIDEEFYRDDDRSDCVPSGRRNARIFLVRHTGDPGPSQKYFWTKEEEYYDGVRSMEYHGFDRLVRPRMKFPIYVRHYLGEHKEEGVSD